MRTSPMTEARGLVSVTRWALGAADSPDGTDTIADLLSETDPPPVDDYMRRLCAGCHLGARRDNRDDAIPFREGSGCGACHVSRSGEGHPVIGGVVDDDRCFGCHSRSGRISLSYQGLFEPGATCDDRLTLHDDRPGCRGEADVHAAAGMACVDCHLHTELMGDGRSVAHEEDALEITCDACHGVAEGPIWGAIDDAITAAVLRQRGESRPPDERAKVGRRGTPIWSIRPDADGWILRGKADGIARRVSPTPSDANHEMAGHERLTCVACHAAWTPRCPTCHIEHLGDGVQWDFARSAEASGRWVETSDGFGRGAPTLAVGADGEIGPGQPGMILQYDGRDGRVEPRLFGRLDPHTTARNGRSCASCHRDPVALGLGVGTLALDGDIPKFTPNPATLGRDRWTTLFAKNPGRGTRRGARSLDAAEQRRVLRVGACLPCHAAADDPVYRDFPTIFEAWRARSSPRTSRCDLTVTGWLRAPRVGGVGATRR